MIYPNALAKLKSKPVFCKTYVNEVFLSKHPLDFAGQNISDISVSGKKVTWEVVGKNQKKYFDILPTYHVLFRCTVSGKYDYHCYHYIIEEDGKYLIYIPDVYQEYIDVEQVIKNQNKNYNEEYQSESAIISPSNQ